MCRRAFCRDARLPGTGASGPTRDSVRYGPGPRTSCTSDAPPEGSQEPPTPPHAASTSGWGWWVLCPLFGATRPPDLSAHTARALTPPEGKEGPPRCGLGVMWQGRGRDSNPASEELDLRGTPEPPVSNPCFLNPNPRPGEDRGHAAQAIFLLLGQPRPFPTVPSPGLTTLPFPLSLPLLTALLVPMATSSSAPGRRAERERERGSVGVGRRPASKGVLHCDCGRPMRANPGACACRIPGDHVVRTGATVCLERGGRSNVHAVPPTAPRA